MLDQGSQPSDLNFSMDMSLSWWDVVVSKENCFANLLKLRSLFSLVSGSHEKCLRHESLGTNAITIKWYYNRRFLKFLCQNCFSYNRPSPASFHIILVLYKQLTEKNCKFQLDLNSDFVNRRHAGSPLDHQHVPLHQNLHIIFH